MKYIMMGTSSNFGNMFSMAGATLILPFLPMLPVQILLNNFLYDISEIADPTRQRGREYVVGRGSGTWPSSETSCSRSGRSARCSTSSPST